MVYAVNQCYEEGLYFGDYLAFCAKAEQRIPRRSLPPAGTKARERLPDDFACIRVRDVTFTYPGSDTPSLNGISLHLRKGEVVALVGENGSGKTTLAKVMGGLYDPDEGEVLWDRVPLTRVAPHDVWERVAVIAQNYTHWPMTARRNITMGRGREHVDGEDPLFERIRTHADGRTVLLITHRLASVRYADRIYVLEHGKVIEEGDHAALMALGGVYADLYSLQAAAYSAADRGRGPDGHGAELDAEPR